MPDDDIVYNYNFSLDHIQHPDFLLYTVENVENWTEIVTLR